MSEERCELTELLISQCSCKNHRGEPKEQPDIFTFIAKYPGKCVDCWSSFEAGTQISPTSRGYRCMECTGEYFK